MNNFSVSAHNYGYNGSTVNNLSQPSNLVGNPLVNVSSEVAFLTPAPLPVGVLTVVPTVVTQGHNTPARGSCPNPTWTDVPAVFIDGVEWLCAHSGVFGYSGTTCQYAGTDPCFYSNTPMTRADVMRAIDQAEVNWPSANDYPLSAPAYFADVNNQHPYWAFIQIAASKNIISGYTCGGTNPSTGTPEPCGLGRLPYFRPDNTITRGQLSKVVVLAENWQLVPPVETFADVPPTNVFYNYIETAASYGLISGYTCGSTGEPCDQTYRPYFRPLNSVTRGQASKIVFVAGVGNFAHSHKYSGSNNWNNYINKPAEPAGYIYPTNSALSRDHYAARADNITWDTNALYWMSNTGAGTPVEIVFHATLANGESCGSSVFYISNTNIPYARGETPRNSCHNPFGSNNEWRLAIDPAHVTVNYQYYVVADFQDSVIERSQITVSNYWEPDIFSKQNDDMAKICFYNYSYARPNVDNVCHQ